MQLKKKTYNLTDVFDISQDGKYRLPQIALSMIKGRGGKSTECELWVEFTVTRIGDTSGDVKKTFVDFVLNTSAQTDITKMLSIR